MSVDPVPAPSRPDDPDGTEGRTLHPDPTIPLRPMPDGVGPRLAARWHDPKVLAVALAVLAGLAALVWLRLGTPHGTPSGAPGERALRRADRLAGTTNPTASGRAVVAQVVGAVLTPGLVRLRDGERVADAIEAAGGARPDADLEAINLAARVADGERIVVPVRGAVVAPGPVGTDGGGSTSGPDGPVHLNTATADDLDTLPGIGPSLAAAIIRAREERGGFRSVQDLQDVRGIGDARMADLAPLVAL